MVFFIVKNAKNVDVTAFISRLVSSKTKNTLKKPIIDLKVLGKKDNVCIYEFEPIECYTTTGEEFFDMDVVEESFVSSLRSSLVNKKQRSLMANK